MPNTTVTLQSNLVFEPPFLSAVIKGLFLSQSFSLFTTNQMTGFYMNHSTGLKGLKWDKVFKSGPIRFSRPYPFKFLKVCLPQILLGPLLNTLSKIITGVK